MRFPVLASAVTVTSLVVAGGACARDRVEFASDPHVLQLDRRQQIVLFASSAVAGAMATRRPDGSFDVVVPDARVAAGLLGRTFSGPVVAAEEGSTSVSLETTEDEDVRVRIRPAGDVARVVAYPVGAPPRLMIDLLPAGSVEAGATPTQRPRRALDPQRARVPAAGHVPPEGPAVEVVGHGGSPSKRAASHLPAGSRPAAEAFAPDPARCGGERPGDTPGPICRAPRPAVAGPEMLATGAWLAEAGRASSSEAEHAGTAEPLPVEVAGVDKDAAATVAAKSAAPDMASEAGAPARGEVQTEDAKRGEHAEVAKTGGPGIGKREETGVEARRVEQAAASMPEVLRVSGPRAFRAEALRASGPRASRGGGLRVPGDRASRGEALRVSGAGDAGVPRVEEGEAASPGAPRAAEAPAVVASPADAGEAVARREARGSAAAQPSARHCGFMRVQGFPFCAPDPRAAGYQDHAYAAGVAHRIAAGATWLAPVRMGHDVPAAPYLVADREFVLRAADGWLLPAVRAYERALRLEPAFSDAIRAHMNIALVYASLGFEPELESRASDPNNPARDFAVALLGDMALAHGKLAEAAGKYAEAAGAGGLPACLAARGLARLALVEGRTPRAVQGIDGLRDLCPRGVLIDADTERLRARVALALGDPDRALATLASASDWVSPRERGQMARERARIAEAAGRVAEARSTWAELAGGRYGAQYALEGTIALARLDGTDQSIEEGLTRAEELPEEVAERARRDLFVGVSNAAIASGDDLTTIALILSDGFAPEMLDVEAQIALAAAYRRLGLLDEAGATLEKIERASESGLVEPYWEERVNLALATGDLVAADAFLSRWRLSRGGNPSGAELALRARVLVRGGAERVELSAVLKRLDGLDADRATATRWRVAAVLAERDPVAAVGILGGEEKLAQWPSLAEAEIVETLWQVGRSAETGGDESTALIAYQALGERLPGTERGADAAYRAGRLLERRQAFDEAERAFRRAATHPAQLERRVATASIGFHEVADPWMRGQEEP